MPTSSHEPHLFHSSWIFPRRVSAAVLVQRYQISNSLRFQLCGSGASLMVFFLRKDGCYLSNVYKDADDLLCLFVAFIITPFRSRFSAIATVSRSLILSEAPLFFCSGVVTFLISSLIYHFHNTHIYLPKQIASSLMPSTTSHYYHLIL